MDWDVFIISVGDGEGKQTGILASWVQQASFEPPMISFAVQQKRYLNDWLKKNPQIVVNTVGQKQFEFLKHFGKGFEPDQPAFEELEIERSSNGLSILKTALGYLEATVVSNQAAGDHLVYFAEVTGGCLFDRDEAIEPMVHIRKDGFGY